MPTAGNTPNTGSQSSPLWSRRAAVGAGMSLLGVAAVSASTEAANAAVPAQMTSLSDTFINVADAPYNVVIDGVTDNSAAIQAAIDDHPDGATLYFPGGICIASNIDLKSRISFLGDGSFTSTLESLSGPLFNQTTGIQYCTFSHMKLRARSGHVFATNGFGVGQCLWTHCTMVQYGAGYSIFHQDGVGGYIDNVVFACDLHRPGTATVPAWYIRNTAGAANANQWVSTRVTGNDAGVYFFHLESVALQTYAYDNLFQAITGELCAGGLIKALGVHGLTLTAVSAWDATRPYDADIIHVNKSSSGLLSREIVIVNSGRRGNTLGAGVYDVNCPQGSVVNCVLIATDRAGGAGHFNLPTTATIIGTTGPGAQLRTGSLGVGNSTTASTLGNVVKRIELFDMNQNSIGFIPVYSSIT